MRDPTPIPAGGAAGSERLDQDVRLLGEMLAEAIAQLDGEEALGRLRELRDGAAALRRGDVAGARERFAARLAALSSDDLARAVRLGDIVICPQLEPDQSIGLFDPRSHHDDGHG